MPHPHTWLKAQFLATRSISYEIPRSVDVKIAIFDGRGQMVRILDLGRQRAGYYVDNTKAAHWNGQNDNGETVSSGVYTAHGQKLRFLAKCEDRACQGTTA